MTAEGGVGAPPRVVRVVAFVCFLVSGACGLTYEIVWVRQLTLVAGATTPAVSTVLAVFMGGLALGARLFGGRADRSRNALKLYAWLELGIGLYGLVQPTLLAAAGAGYVVLMRDAALEGVALLGARLAVAAAVLLLPCVLMGGTLPVLVRVVGRSKDRLGLDLGTLYGINLAGAVLGSLLTGFVLVRALGVHGTIITAALGNMLVALAAYVASTRLHAPTAVAQPDRPEGRRGVPPAPPYVLLWGLAGMSGLATMGYQVAWTRMLSFGFDSTVYAFTIILVTFLLGLSLGSLAFARLDRRVQRPRLLLAAHVLGGLTALALAPLATRQPELLSALTERFGFTAEAQLTAMGLGATAVMLLPATLMGIVFPLVARLLVDEVGQMGRQLGRAYWINTLGSILGSLLTGFVLIPALSVKGCLVALAAAQVGAGLLLLPWCAVQRRSQAVLALAFAAALVVVGGVFERLLPGRSPFDQILIGQRVPAKLLAHRDDVTASVSVVESEGGWRALRINGFETANDDPGGTYMPMMSHLPMLLHPHPRNVLVICFGTGSTAGAALYYPDAHVDVVDINRAVLDFAPLFARTNHGVFKDPRAHLIVDDGRNYLLATRRTYDVVTSEPMPPTHAGVVNLYSREYYELARRRLAPGGLLVQWLPFHLLRGREALDILQTVRSVFPETTLWMHSLTGIIVARADGPVRVDWPRLQEAWRNPVLAQELARLGVPRPLDLTDDYMLGPEGVEELAKDGHVVSDDHPTLEFHPPRHKLLERTGRYTHDQAVVLEAIYRLRAHTVFPVDGLAPDEVRLIQLMFNVQSVMLQGDLQLELEKPEEARRLYETGLQLDPDLRPVFLLKMAVAEHAAGHLDEARRLVRDTLALQPGNEQAQAMLREIEEE
jgi:spermidine synthase